MLKHALLQLPEKWKWSKLGDILIQKPQYGLTAKSVREPNGIVYIRISDIKENGKLKTDDLRYVKLDKETFKKYELKENDILIARSGSVGRVYIHKDFDKPCVFASYLIRFNLNQNLILPKFFFYFSFTSFYRNFIAETFKIVAQPNINAKQFSRLLIPLPPIEEQKRIVAKLDEIFSKIEKARKLREEALKDTEQIMHSALNEVFSKAEEKGWKLVKLGNIVEINKESKNPSIEMPKKEFTYIDISGVKGWTGEIIETKKFLGKDAPSRARRVIHTNNIIMSTVRPYLRAFAIITPQYNNQICSTGFAVITCSQNIIPKFLLYALLSDFVIKQCNQIMAGAHYPALTQTQVSKLILPFPPIEEQKRVAEYLDKLQEKVILLKKHQEETQKEIEMLASSVLNKAFTGML